MHVYLVLMLAADCQQYVYGAYARRAQACEAVERCEKFEKLWQHQAWHDSRVPSHTLILRATTAGKPKGKIEAPGPLNLCIVQRVEIGEDDKVTDVACEDKNVLNIDWATEYPKWPPQ